MPANLKKKGLYLSATSLGLYFNMHGRNFIQMTDGAHYSGAQPAQN